MVKVLERKLLFSLLSKIVFPVSALALNTKLVPDEGAIKLNVSTQVPPGVSVAVRHAVLPKETATGWPVPISMLDADAIPIFFTLTLIVADLFPVNGFGVAVILSIIRSGSGGGELIVNGASLSS